MKKNLPKIILLLMLFVAVRSMAQTVAPFKKGDRVVFVGNSITDGGHYHSYIWLYYMTRFPDQRLDMFNAGIGGDVAEQIYRRFDGDVLDKKPTVVTLTFGMNDTKYFEFNSKDADEIAKKSVATSYASYKKIEEKLKALPAVRKVLIVSSPYDETVKLPNNYFPKKSLAMLEVAKFQEEAAKKNNWGFVDFNRPMTAINTKGQQTDSLFTICGGDRIHPGQDGHMIMAYIFLKNQGLQGKPVSDVVINTSAKTAGQAVNCAVTGIQGNGSSIKFDYLAKALPYPVDTIARGWGATTSQAQALKLIPFTNEFNKEMLTVKNLAPGKKYSLKIDGQMIGNWTAAQFAEGINLAEQTKTPQYQQAQTIMFLNEDRWELERRLRVYAWVEYNVLWERNLLFKDNLSTLDTLESLASGNGWLRGNLDNYKRLRTPESRQALNKQLETIVSTIYSINKPKKRHYEIDLVP